VSSPTTLTIPSPHQIYTKFTLKHKPNLWVIPLIMDKVAHNLIQTGSPQWLGDRSAPRQHPREMVDFVQLGESAPAKHLHVGQMRTRAQAMHCPTRAPTRRTLYRSSDSLGLGGIVALYLCTTAHPLRTRFASIFGAFFLKRQCDRTLWFSPAWGGKELGRPGVRKLCRVGPNCETWPNTLTENTY
jgi:hypothetical protein